MIKFKIIMLRISFEILFSYQYRGIHYMQQIQTKIHWAYINSIMLLFQIIIQGRTYYIL